MLCLCLFFPFQPTPIYLDCAAGDYFKALYDQNALNGTSITHLAELIILSDIDKDTTKE